MTKADRVHSTPRRTASKIKRNKPRPKSKKRWIEKTDWTAQRDALPFFNKGKRGQPASWWSVKPSGDYATDLETGFAYAKAFLPLMIFNAGASTLGMIVSHMALSGRDRSQAPKDWRSIDSIALGFMMGIGGSLQSAIACIGLAAVAIKKPEGDLGPKFVKLVESGNALDPMRHSTLFHDPCANIFSAGAGR